MKIDVEAIDRVQKRQISESPEAFCKRFGINGEEIIRDAIVGHGRNAATFLSGLSTGIELGIELERDKPQWQSCDPEPVESHDGFLEST